MGTLFLQLFLALYKRIFVTVHLPLALSGWVSVYCPDNPVRVLALGGMGELLPFFMHTGTRAPCPYIEIPIHLN